MLATLQDAPRTLLGARYGSRHPKCQREDLEWLMSDDHRQPFAYARICEALGIDAGWLRSRVIAAPGVAMEVGPRGRVHSVEAAEGWADLPIEAQGGGR